jgi:hypothetical protein
MCTQYAATDFIFIFSPSFFRGEEIKGRRAAPLGQGEKCRVPTANEFLDFGAPLAKQLSNYVCWAIAQAYPNHLRRRSVENTEAVEVIVLGDDRKAMLSGMVPNFLIGRAKQASLTDMNRIRKYVRKSRG